MKTLLKLAGCWAAYVASLFVFSALLAALKLHMNAPTPQSSAGTMFLMSLLSGMVLVAGLFPIARGLAGGAGLRVMAMGVFLVLAFGVNTMIEASFFTTLQEGSRPGTALYFGCITLAVGLSLGLLFGGKGEGAGLRHPGAVDGIGRGLIAWLGWPVIYFLFGMCIAPIVVPYYHSISWLRIPSAGTIVGVQLLRSPIFLASSLPLIALWKGSRRGLWLSLGLAHLAAVGLFGLVGSTFIPGSIRMTHALEITGDSFAYAGLLVLLFAGQRTEVREQRSVASEEWTVNSAH